MHHFQMNPSLSPFLFYLRSGAGLKRARPDFPFSVAGLQPEEAEETVPAEVGAVLNPVHTRFQSPQRGLESKVCSSSSGQSVIINTL